MNAITKAYIALGLVCFFWGTTFIAARIGVSGYPAFFFMGCRNFTAGLVLLTIISVKKKTFPSIFTDIRWPDVRAQIIPGLLMICLGTGVVGWSVQFIPSGLAALIYCSVPILTIAINTTFLKGERINSRIAIGMLLGVAGIFLIFRGNLNYIQDPQSLKGVIIALASCFFWCFGGLYTKIYVPKTDSFFNAAIQMMAGGLGLFVLSLISEDWAHLPVIGTKSLLALLYLIFFGSILAFGSFVYAMDRLPAGLVSIYAYINPLVALTLGFLILDEKISWMTLLAFGVTVSGVFLVNMGYRLEKRKLEEATISVNHD
ncbi:DMT family transporter [Dyadobacter luticola]|uniref:EamA family transporter n=1 Tax=Dyadobacter luticola TaxID=1979387 RepID=A0A5R9L3Y8_9BACT|nr:EamA family transporter [Dyadobacter luticola]TLV03097.1 EamA family transporter [Dyadobacter luticola]